MSNDPEIDDSAFISWCERMIEKRQCPQRGIDKKEDEKHCDVCRKEFEESAADARREYLIENFG